MHTALLVALVMKSKEEASLCLTFLGLRGSLFSRIYPSAPCHLVDSHLLCFVFFFSVLHEIEVCLFVFSHDAPVFYQRLKIYWYLLGERIFVDLLKWLCIGKNLSKVIVNITGNSLNFIVWWVNQNTLQWFCYIPYSLSLLTYDILFGIDVVGTLMLFFHKFKLENMQ